MAEIPALKHVDVRGEVVVDEVGVRLLLQGNLHNGVQLRDPLEEGLEGPGADSVGVPGQHEHDDLRVRRVDRPDEGEQRREGEVRAAGAVVQVHGLAPEAPERGPALLRVVHPIGQQHDVGVFGVLGDRRGLHERALRHPGGVASPAVHTTHLVACDHAETMLPELALVVLRDAVVLRLEREAPTGPTDLPHPRCLQAREVLLVIADRGARRRANRVRGREVAWRGVVAHVHQKGGQLVRPRLPDNVAGPHDVEADPAAGRDERALLRLPPLRGPRPGRARRRRRRGLRLGAAAVGVARHRAAVKGSLGHPPLDVGERGRRSQVAVVGRVRWKADVHGPLHVLVARVPLLNGHALLLHLLALVERGGLRTCGELKQQLLSLAGGSASGTAVTLGLGLLRGA
mmetsp:Transcript_29366/g.83574  ORF Transcript_29366/g.83574 Transcript_29366/m.83574 type:complete len:401 (+) Transcript_29366:335-1537(+)